MGIRRLLAGFGAVTLLTAGALQLLVLTGKQLQKRG